MFQKIVFLVSSLSQPRAIRRVESIAALGIDVEVYGYDRGQYNCNTFSPNISVNILGEMSKGGGYLGKVKQIKGDIADITSSHRKETCLYYSFGFIETFFLKQAGVSYAYEISDIAYSGGTLGKIRPILKQVDKRLVKHSEFTLMTSEGFKRYLNVKDSNVIIQPNKVNRKLIGCERNVLNKKDNKYIFSFVGSIRYEPILMFAKVIGERFPQHEFHFHGVANVEATKQTLDKLTNKYPNVKMFGAFKNPDDFERIYNSVDIVVTTYGLTFNERILDPNKLYEGILFCRPLVSTSDTFLADQIVRYNCGWNIDSSTENNVAEFISKLTPGMVNMVSAAEKEIADDFAFDNMDNLSALLSSIVVKK